LKVGRSITYGVEAKWPWVEVNGSAAVAKEEISGDGVNIQKFRSQISQMNVIILHLNIKTVSET
jgi:hypothetical protein